MKQLEQKREKLIIEQQTVDAKLQEGVLLSPDEERRLALICIFFMCTSESILVSLIFINMSF